jgi:hypothetical protein
MAPLTGGGGVSELPLKLGMLTPLQPASTAPAKMIVRVERGNLES